MKFNYIPLSLIVTSLLGGCIAVEGVRYAWLVDPIARTLEVFALGENGRWQLAGEHRGAVRVRVVPFDALELELAAIWGE